MPDTLEGRISDLGRRIERIERRLDGDAPVGAVPLSLSDWLRLLGWLVAGGSAMTFLICWWLTGIAVWTLALPAAVGAWLVLRGSSFFDLSGSTIGILQEERSSRRPHAAALHKAAPKAGPVTSERLVTLFGASVGGIVIVLALAAAVLAWVPTTGGQTLVLAALLVAMLAYGLSGRSRTLVLCSTVGLYALMLTSSLPLLSIFLTAGLSAWLGTVSFRRADYNLMLFVLAGTYAVLGRWGFEPSGEAAVKGIVAEMAIMAALTFALPFAGLRRTAADREKVRWIAGLNTAAYTAIFIYLFRIIFPAQWAAGVCVMLFSGFAVAALAWQAHGRASYAKYFMLASLAGFLVAGILFLDSALVTLVWLMASVVLLTVGFASQSYTFRLAGLIALGATLIRYLGITLPAAGTASPVAILQDKVWIGGLLSLFLMIAGIWYRDLRSRGSEERYRLSLAAVLYSLAALTLCALVAVEILRLTY